MKILIVDDDENLLEAVQLMLTHHNHEVDVSNSPTEAIEMLGKATYDFILLDYRMPDNTGIWFMENADLSRETKVLLTTAFANREIISRMFELGASGYLIKPFDEEDLIHNLEFHSQPQPPPPDTI